MKTWQICGSQCSEACAAACNMPEGDMTANTDITKGLLCPTGWTLGAHRCFMYNGTGRNFDQAVAYCESIGGAIASIHGDGENNAVLAIIPESDIAYIGAMSDGNGIWSWYDGSAWWQPAVHGGLSGREETRIIISGSDRLWHDVDQSLHGVICSKATLTGSLATYTACLGGQCADANDTIVRQITSNQLANCTALVAAARQKGLDCSSDISPVVAFLPLGTKLFQICGSQCADTCSAAQSPCSMPWTSSAAR